VTAPRRHAARPTREDVRPRLRRGVVTAEDIAPELLALYPGLVDELNLCPCYVWRGQGRPSIGWHDWETVLVRPADALAMPVGGEA
jgi:hypothetical protein